MFLCEGIGYEGVALHTLCNILNQKGYRCDIWDILWAFSLLAYTKLGYLFIVGVSNSKYLGFGAQANNMALNVIFSAIVI